LNLTSSNYLGLSTLDCLKKEAHDTIVKYGVGSCGPRGFYGTIDLHLILEETFARFMRGEAAILYSDGMGCLSSVIPAFSKGGDYIMADSEVNCGIQQGLKLSRSKVTKFEHNNMSSLENLLKQNDSALTPAEKTKHRRFIVVEGIYSKTGSLCPLDEVVKLAKKYKFRVILDDSNAIGVLGKTGRGSLEHYGLKVDEDVALVCATLDQACSSVGGLCVGSKHAISHQRLSGSGYCFSAASPPYTARVAAYAFGLIDNNHDLMQNLQKKTSFAYKICVSKLQSVGFDVIGNVLSPIIVFRPSASFFNKWIGDKNFGSDDQSDKCSNNNSTNTHTHAPVPYITPHKLPGTEVGLYLKLKQIALILREEFNIIISTQHHAPQEELYPYGLKIQVTLLHSEDDITLCADALAKVTQRVLGQ
jgi:serine palmitoyltransferase